MPRSEFDPLDKAVSQPLPGQIGGRPTPAQEEELRRADDVMAIRIRNIDMASRHVMTDYMKYARWFCLSVRNRCEFAVEKALLDSDIEACVPRRMGEKKMHRHRQIPAPVLPVIPGYLLVKCVPTPAAFLGLRGVDDVTGIVGKGEMPYRVPVKFIEPFMALAQAGAYDYRPQEHGFERFMNVRVIDGPFASFAAVVTGIDKAATEGRINVEVNIFGRSTPIEMDIAQIEKL